MKKVSKIFLLFLMALGLLLISCDDKSSSKDDDVTETYPEMTVVGLEDGGSTDSRTHTLVAQVPNPGEGGFDSGRAVGDVFDGSIRVYVNESFALAYPYYSTENGAWEISQDLSLVSGENDIYIAVFESNGDLFSESQTITVTGTFDPAPYRVRLYWDNEGDVDLHLVKDDDWSGNHCYYSNEDIGYAELDYDNVFALGPEHITVYSNATAGSYKIYVKYYSADVADSIEATVTLFKEDVEIDSWTHTFTVDDVNTGTSSYDSTRDWYVDEFIID